MRGFESLCINLDNSVETRRTSCRHLWFSDLGSGIKIVLLSLAKYCCTQDGRTCAEARRAFAEKFGPNIRYFVAILWFVAIYALLEDSGQKKCSFGAKQCFLGKKCPITWLVMSCLLILLISCQNGHICLPQLCSAFKDVEIKRWVTHSLSQWLTTQAKSTIRGREV